MTRRPTPEALRVAAEWCDCYEGAPSLKAVVAWLDAQALKASRERFVRQAMKETGCSKAHAVRVWKEHLGAPKLKTYRAFNAKGQEVRCTVPESEPEGGSL